MLFINRKNDIYINIFKVTDVRQCGTIICVCFRSKLDATYLLFRGTSLKIQTLCIGTPLINSKQFSIISVAKQI